MLLLYLQDYDAVALKRLSELCASGLDFEWDARVAKSAELPMELIRKIDNWDVPALFIMEDTQYENLDVAVSEIRAKNALTYLVLSVPSELDALRLRPPYYRPAGFLLSPPDKETLRKLLTLIYNDYSSAHAEHGGFFTVKVRGATYLLPYSQILYFESNSKKIIVRKGAQEYEFYGSLEQISAEAPGFFLRVHKSFCINLNHVSAANYNEKILIMSDDSAIPFSRTYRLPLEEALAKSRIYKG